MNIKRGTLTVIAFIIIGKVVIAEDKRSHPTEQVEFSAEDDAVHKAVPVPQSVLAFLKKDEEVRIALGNQNISADRIPLSWFSASAVHLSSLEEVDFVVVGEGPLHGSNVTTFWIFRPTANGYELVLKAPAHDLRVENARWKGYRSIELISTTAAEVSTVICRFTGQRYAQYKTTSKPIH